MKPDIFNLYHDEEFWNYDPEYELDFNSNPPRKYRESRGVRFYENGSVEIQFNNYYQPLHRTVIEQAFGIIWKLKSRLFNYKFTRPDGSGVLKKEIATNILLVDEEHKMLKAWNWRDPKITYLGSHARPAGGSPIIIRVLNKPKLQHITWQTDNFFKFARTYAEMNNICSKSDIWSMPGRETSLYQLIDDFLVDNKTREMPVPNMRNESNRKTIAAAGLAVKAGEHKDTLISLATDEERVPYLYFTRKEKNHG